MPKHSRDIFGENVELEIHQIACLCTVEVGVLLGIGDNPGDETPRKNFSGRKADSVHRNRPFWSDITGELSWKRYFQSKIHILLVEGEDRRRAIDVALHEMSAEAAIGAQRALQIYLIVPEQFFQIRASDRFFEKIERQIVAPARS